MNRAQKNPRNAFDDLKSSILSQTLSNKQSQSNQLLWFVTLSNTKSFSSNEKLCLSSNFEASSMHHHDDVQQTLKSCAWSFSLFHEWMFNTFRLIILAVAVVSGNVSKRFIAEWSKHTSLVVGHDVGYEVSARQGKLIDSFCAFFRRWITKSNETSRVCVCDVIEWWFLCVEEGQRYAN